MTEYDTVWQAFGAGIGLVLSSLLYSLGGRSGKWKRRFVGSFILAGTLVTLCLLRGLFSWWLLLTWPLLVAGYSIGYGADLLGVKVLKRLVYAITVISAGVVCAYLFSAWWVLIPHVGVGLWSVYLGVRNPVEAAAEEFFISMLLGLGLMMYPFVSV